MTTCKDVYAFLTQVANRSVTAPPAAADADLLSRLGLVQFLTGDQFRQLSAEVQTLGAAQAALSQEMASRSRVAGSLELDTEKTHSILFHLHGSDKQAAELQQESQDLAQLRALDADLAQRQAAFNDLVAKRSLFDTLTPVGTGYVGLTGLGALEYRNLGVRLYRVADSPFESYWNQSQRITAELNSLADGGATYFARLAPLLSGADRSYLWAISIGLSKAQPDPSAGAQRFLEAYNAAAGLSGNLENRLMSAEIMFSLPRAIKEQQPLLAGLVGQVRKLGVPSEAALGVSAILLFSQRRDGTFALPSLKSALGITRSYESAALLATLSVDFSGLAAKFQSMHAMFAGWGYQPSEDVELASAYLTVSELPVEGMSTKLSIVARGMSTYLQYPLVAASILSSVSTLEANETLGLLEQAYNIVGRRAGGMTQAELISLAVRMVHGIRNELVGTLDATATARATPPGMAGPYAPRFFFLPLVVVHGGYFATYSGMGGAHPGHVHGMTGGGFAGGGFG